MADDYKFNKRVTLCFHYFLGSIKNNGEEVPYPFTKGHLDNIETSLNGLMNLNVKDSKYRNKMITRELISIQSLNRVDAHTLTGVYKQTYYGQAFENEDYGKIPADSINLRPFFFGIYLAPSGRLYLISQFLGSSGGFSALKRVISSFLNGISLDFMAINTSFENIQNMTIKGTHITLNSVGKNIDSKNLEHKIAAVSIPRSPDDLDLEDRVSKKVIPFLKTDMVRAKRELASIFNSSLVSFNAENIEDCSLVMIVDKKRTISIPLFDEDAGPSRIVADVKLDGDGNPNFEKLETLALQILEDRILGKMENV